MKIDFKLTDKQALKIATTIYNGNFRVYGICHFDISVDEFAQVIKIAFNESRDADLKVYDYFNLLLGRLS